MRTRTTALLAMVTALAAAISGCAAPPKQRIVRTDSASCERGQKLSEIGCIPEHSSVVAGSWWACDPPYFKAYEREACIDKPEERKVVVYTTGFLAGQANTGPKKAPAGAASTTSSAAGGFASPSVSGGAEDQGGCCWGRGGEAGCFNGRQMCRDGTASPTCSC